MILFILYEFVTDKQKGASGGNISNYLLIEELSKHKEVLVLAPNVPVDLCAELESKGISVISDSHEFRPPFRNLKKRVWFSKAITTYILQNSRIMANLDIIITSNGTCDLTRNFPKKGVRNFIICRAFEDFFDHSSHYPLKEQIRRNIRRFTSAKKISTAYRSADMIITNSAFMQNFINKRYPNSNVKILYPPIDIPLKQFKYLTDHPRIGIINPSDRKGEKMFLSLANSNPNLNFVYFSQHPKNYTTSNISYGGWLSDREELFSKIDILIAPSVWDEPFGRVSVEAVRSGLPVLVSNTGGLPETVDDYFIVKTPSLENWNCKLLELLASPREVKNAWERSATKSASFEQTQHNIVAFEIFT